MHVIRFGLIGALISAVLLQSGCSFLFVKGPPDNHAEMASFDCSESNALPVLDLIWAGLNGIGAASAAGDDQIMNQEQIVGVGLAWVVVSGISAISGFSKVSKCKDARRQRERRYESYELERMRAPAPVSAPAAPAPATAPVPPPAAPAPPPAAAPAPLPAAPAPPA
jgi:hypothetical protein